MPRAWRLFAEVEEGVPRCRESPRKHEAYFSEAQLQKPQAKRHKGKSVTALTAKTSKYLQRGLIPLLQSNQSKGSGDSLVRNNTCPSHKEGLITETSWALAQLCAWTLDTAKHRFSLKIQLSNFILPVESPARKQRWWHYEHPAQTH